MRLQNLNLRRILRYLLRKFYLLLAIIVIAVAVVVQLGRNFSYLLSDYSDEIAAMISDQAKVQVSFASINARWDGLQPSMVAREIRIENNQGELLGEMAQAHMRLDLIASLMQLQLVWSHVALSGGSLTLEQAAEGHWSLRGVPADALSGTTADEESALLDILLAARRIRFSNTQLHFKFESGDIITLLSPSVLVENSGDFHRLLVNVDVEENKDALFFILESDGDPRESSSAIASYIQFRDFPLSTPADVITAQFVNDHLGQGDLKGTLNASIWLNKVEDSPLFSMAGNIALSDASLPVGEGQFHLQALSADLSGWMSGLRHWQLGASSLAVLAMGHQQKDMAVLATRSGAGTPLKFQLSQLNLGWLNQVIQGGGILSPGGRLEHLAQSLDARGTLRNIQLVIPPEQPELWQISAMTDQVELGSWNGAPGVTGISGYVTANARQGVVQLDSDQNFSLMFDNVYEDPMHFSRVQGQVSWLLRKDQNLIDVYSGKILAADGDETLQGQFHLNLPYQRKSGAIQLTISATAQNVAAVQYKKYLPQVVPGSLRDYLARGIGNNNAGIARQAQFIYRGVLNEHTPASHNVALKLDMANASFHYHDSWPEVHDIQGQILVDNTNVYAQIESARLYNSQVTGAQITLSDNPEDEGKLLRVRGAIDGIASDGLRVLRQTVLRQFVGSQMDSWFLHGDMQAAIDIDVPLKADAKGARHSVILDVDASSFDLDNLALSLDEFKGRIRYDDKTGIQTQNLQAQLFGHPLQLSLYSDRDDSGLLTVIDAQASATAEQLAHWSEQPGLLFIDGEIPVSVRVELNHGQTDSNLADQRQAAISVEADLTDAEVSLPAPLAKEKGDDGQVIVNYIIGSETTFADIHYLDKARAMLHLAQGGKGLISGVIALGAEPQLPVEKELRISGEIGQIDVPAWQDVLNRYHQYQQAVWSQKGLPENELTLPSISSDLLIRRQPLGPVALTDVRLQARQLENGWDFLIHNSALSGELFWPTLAAEPLRVAISRLDIPAELLEKKDSNTSWRISGTENWPSADITIDSLQLAGEDYGKWSFKLQPGRDLLTFSQITGEVRGIQVSGIEGDDASIVWHLGESPVTELTAELRVEDMLETLKAWGVTPSLEGEDASYTLNLLWPAAPTDVSLEKLSGTVSLNIGQGRYLRNDSGASDGLLKVLGLFNFDSLARRARLDFSDLYKSGLAFDSITGAVRFNEGLLTISDAFKLQSPSSRMELTGQVNLIEQTLDTRLVATLPMSGNLTVIAALAAGLPAAAGVFVISKLFEEQMNKVTSVRYSIVGDWDNPTTKFLGVADSSDE